MLPELKIHNNDIFYRLATSNDIPKCFEIESASYPEDEAATLGSLTYRQETATPYFLVCCHKVNKEQGLEKEQILGFICATRCDTFTHESMSSHNPQGKFLAIHSVVITEPARRKGIATKMLKEYIYRQKSNLEYTTTDDKMEEIVLMAKHYLLGFYIHCGFRVEKESDIVHGKDIWYELRMSLNRPSSDMKYYIVDSFSVPVSLTGFESENNSSYGGTGNPAAVVLMREGDTVPKTSVTWLQKIAAEFNLSETAYLWKKPDSHIWDIRYYTPDGTEIDLCGHATLASAFVLLHKKDAHDKINSKTKTREVVFSTNKNVTLRAFSSTNTTIHMNFPWKDVISIEPSTSLYSATIEMLQSSLVTINKTKSLDDIQFLGMGEDEEDLFVELTHDAFQSLPETNDILYSYMVAYDGPRRGIIVCCEAEKGDHGINFYSRFFGPKAGINEDPVTGSAHCLLGPYFGRKLNKTFVIGMQKSKRGGIIKCDLNEEEKKVEIIGETTLVMHGQLCV